MASTDDPPRWSFWIDVGGTFTDCVARRPDGRIERLKVLSSGATKGAVGAGGRPDRLLDAARTADPPGFWAGAELRLLDRDGRTVDVVPVADSLAGELRLARPLDPPPVAGQAYELLAGWEAPVLAIRRLLGLPAAAPLPPLDVRLGTTRGTNALLTRRGARTAFVTTRGFGDILHIGYQNRPRLFDLAIRKPTPLFETTVEIDERVALDGRVLRPLDLDDARRRFAALRRTGVESLAICLLHAYRHPGHEQALARAAVEAGFRDVSVSHEVAPLVKLVSRGDTTVVDAYLNPVLRSYLDRIAQQLAGPLPSPADDAASEVAAEAAGAPASDSPAAPAGVDLRLLTSAGGLVSAGRFRGKDSVLSGPAGGVVGYSQAARACGFARAVGFDMGGTSTDVSRFDGRLELEYETEKAGVRIVAPMLAIETVAAGGGSICGFDGVKLTVGPDSAGADPGPACYGRGGPLAVTDLNLLLGRLPIDEFPFPLDRAAVDRRTAERIEQIAAGTGVRYTPESLAAGYLRIADAAMAKAVRSISVAKGFDVRDDVLVAFGGAAPQHACAVADLLGVRRILVPFDASVLSAYGIGLADVVRHRAAGVYRDYSPQAVEQLAGTFDALAAEARREVRAEGVPEARLVEHRALELRYRGVDASLVVPLPADGDYARQFAADHRRLYGYVHATKPLEIVAARVEVVGRSDVVPPSSRPAPPVRPAASSQRPVWFDGRAHDTPVYHRDTLPAGAVVAGPALIVQAHSTTVVEPGWTAARWTAGELLLERSTPLDDPAARQVSSHVSSRVSSDLAARSFDAAPDPATLEIFNHQFAAVAQQMGITLRNTSSSVNVKERLDFSCAVFTAAGDLVVNAPHIPVHLGAMSQTVRAVLADNPDLRPGDVFVTNDPYRGGSHLPDVTVVTPVHSPHDGRLLFCTASRAHHAEIGGVSPGSMPPFSRSLAEEGVLLSNLKVVDAGRPCFDELAARLQGGPYPSRAVADNLADLEAQIAANRQGARDLLRLVDEQGAERVLAYMRHIQDAAERKTRAALARLPDGRRDFVEHLDDGSTLQVAVTIAGDSAVFDFTGSGPVHPENLNANRAIVTAATTYVLRCLLAEDIPLNQGVLAPVTLVIPPGLLDPPAGATPASSPAVVGGNVETSQRIVDLLLGALGLAAASQGTMNNLLFGDDSFGYYETICGGAGATADADGADAVHTHMTNTRLTDPELLEQRFPVRVLEFSVRRGSGGRGRRRGGDGVVRRLEFLRPLAVSLLTQRRGPYAPYGVDGGLPGALGENRLRKAGETTDRRLPGRVRLEVEPGDQLTLLTPGGGGWGTPVDLPPAPPRDPAAADDSPVARGGEKNRG